jgi:hypothetical protein
LLKVTNTSIVARNYNSRGLITHGADSRALVRQSDGTLWAALKENTVPDYLHLYRSQDGGFSWERVWQGNFSNSVFRKVGLGNNNTNGPHLSLQVFEHLDRLVLWQSYYDVPTDTYNAEPFTWKLSDPTERLTDPPYIATVVNQADSLALDVPYNDNYSWLIYVSGSNLMVKQYRPLYQTAAEGTFAFGGDYYDIFQGCAHRNGWVDIAILEDLGSANALRHVTFVSGEGGFTGEHTILQTAGYMDITDVGIARDAWDNLCVVWSQETADNSNTDAFYSISRDQGVSWSVPQRIEKSIGHAAYRDPATARLAARSRVLGGHQGFVLSYVHATDELAKTYVRTLLTEDGATYNLGDEREVATNAAREWEPVTGLQWFRPPAASLLDLSDVGQVRVAYSIGEGNSRVQVDTQPVRIGQENLSESAYPSSLASYSDTYEVEGGNAFQLPVRFVSLGAPNENDDYYAMGLIGHVTYRYIGAFRKVGTEMRLQRFDPIPEAEMDDRSAYWAPVEFTSLAILDPQTYQFPLAQRGTDGYESHIERDLRQLYLPPTMHLSRDFVLNNGGHLKRTVWLVTFNGNDYELSQNVPYLIDGVIAYYACNAYVVGPSHDPFSARRLPSET